MRLPGRIATVPGVGAGIGEAVAERFAEEGACLALVQGDISKEDDARRISEAAVESFGGIDILVNNAANFTQKSVEEAELADWQRVFGVNVFGTALVTRFAIPHLKNSRGAIVNVASMSGVIAQADFATYNSSKGAEMLMSRCLATDLAPFGVRVNSVCPGCVPTSASFREIARLGRTFEQWRDNVAPLRLLNRLGDPREIANAVLFPASDEASFITGTELMVDGGYTAR